MILMKRLHALFLLLLLSPLLLPAQTLDTKSREAIADYFSSYTPSGGIKIGSCRLNKGKNNILVNKNSRTVTLYVSDNFANQLFTPQINAKIYSDIKRLLPSAYSGYRIIIYSAEMSIDALIPNRLRENKGIDESRLWGDKSYSGKPWVVRDTRAYTVSRGLEGRHIALWQSHGRFFQTGSGKWRWQRPNLFCTTEDLFTQSIVVPFLMPMLENAGAVVYTPRERDWQKSCTIVDNDATAAGSGSYYEESANGSWKSIAGRGYGPYGSLLTGYSNPFESGTARYIEAEGSGKKPSASAKWIPAIPETGEYAVYVSYQTVPGSVNDAHYQVVHKGGVSSFTVNQQMGGGTWVYLGTFLFEKGTHESQMVILTNNSEKGGTVCADAVRFGGGMGCIARDGSSTSGLPRFLEGARYYAQFAGFPAWVYSPSQGENDYTDDINCRSFEVNYLSGGSVYNPDTVGLNVPLELSMGLHSDAGVSTVDDYIGSLGIVTTAFQDGKLSAGLSRYTSRDLAQTVLANVSRDVCSTFDVPWNVRGIWDRSYSESRMPVIPSMILESMSHQNFADMKLGHDPNFKFTFARAIYKAILQYITSQHGEEYVVQPLPVKNFRIEFNGKKENSLTVSWEQRPDPLEPTAKAEEYILYTRINDNGFDDGVRIKGESCNVNIVPGFIYSFKVTAANKGGESFPSEILSACKAEGENATVMVVNNFHRLGAPAAIQTDTQEGFDLDADPGVAYHSCPYFCGRQIVFDRSRAGREDGLGLSGTELEGEILGGNTFDYPYLHGKAIADNHYSFVSCSSEAVQERLIDLTRYAAVDLIMGVEKETPSTRPFNYSYPYKTFPALLRNELTRYCNAGGRIFVSGSYIASDMTGSDEERDFIRNTLKYDYGGQVSDLNEKTVSGSKLMIEIPRTLNEKSYTVPCPDVLIPVSPAFVSFIFKGSKQSAGIAYQGKYRVLATSFPFEVIPDETHRTQLMGAVLRFLSPAPVQKKAEPVTNTKSKKTKKSKSKKK